jgi:uncharacterized SAM-binding protein YcdF (DUF218 family)
MVAGVRGPALVVLGCKVSARGLSPAAERRVATAAAAWRRGGHPVVLASGGRRWGTVVEAVEMGRALTALGVPEDRIALELASLSTLENARFSAEILRGMGIGDAVIATCDWHAPRALRDFESFGLRVSGVLAVSPRVAGWARLRRDAREACSEALDARLRPALAHIGGDA